MSLVATAGSGHDAQEIGELIHDLVHELRQPLSAIAICCELLLQRPDVPVEARAWVRRIVDERAAMSRLCQEMVYMVEETS